METSQIIRLPVLLTLVLLAACNRTPESKLDAAAEEEAIRQVRQEHLDAAKAHDLDKLVATFAEDGVEMPPNSEPIIGRDAYRTYCEATLSQMGDFDASFEAVELVVSGDWAFEHGTYTVSFSLPDSQPVEDRGKYLWTYKREADGKWRFARICFNTSKPLSSD